MESPTVESERSIVPIAPGDDKEEFELVARDSRDPPDEARATISINLYPLTISPSHADFRSEGEEQVFTVSGGKGAYTFSYPSGLHSTVTISESGNQATVVSGDIKESFDLRVTDKYGSVSAHIDVNLLVIDPPSATLTYEGVQNFTATGGVSPYTFSIITPAVLSSLIDNDDDTADVTASTVEENFQVLVKDSATPPNTDIANVNIVAPVMLDQVMVLVKDSGYACASSGGFFHVVTFEGGEWSYSIPLENFTDGYSLSSYGVYHNTLANRLEAHWKKSRFDSWSGTNSVVCRMWKIGDPYPTTINCGSVPPGAYGSTAGLAESFNPSPTESYDSYTCTFNAGKRRWLETVIDGVSYELDRTNVLNDYSVLKRFRSSNYATNSRSNLFYLIKKTDDNFCTSGWGCGSGKEDNLVLVSIDRSIPSMPIKKFLNVDGTYNSYSGVYVKVGLLEKAE
jgi:hypothetical protein